jgi:hypothetical protein
VELKGLERAQDNIPPRLYLQLLIDRMIELTPIENYRIEDLVVEYKVEKTAQGRLQSKR